MSAPDVLERFVTELAESARALDTLEEAAAAEAWASGAVAEWLALGGRPGRLALSVRSSPLAASLIEWVEGGDRPTAGPEWIGDVGAHRAVEALEVGAVRADGEPDQRALVVEYVAPSGRRHSVSVTVVDGVATDLTLGPAELADAVSEAEQDDEFSLRRLPVEDAEQLMRDALAVATVESLTPDAALNRPVLCRRAGLPVAAELPARPSAPAASAAAQPARSSDDDRYAAELVRSALHVEPIDDAVPVPAAVDEARRAFARRVASGEPDAHTLLSVAGLDSAGAGEQDESAVDLDSFLRLVGAYLAPLDLSAHEPEAARVIAELEWADWVGAILGVVRSGPGTVVDGRVLVDLINRCGEVTTTIPTADRARVAWAFEAVLYSWEITGVIDSEAALTSAGAWLLPRAAIVVWS